MPNRTIREQIRYIQFSDTARPTVEREAFRKMSERLAEELIKIGCVACVKTRDEHYQSAIYGSAYMPEWVYTLEVELLDFRPVKCQTGIDLVSWGSPQFSPLPEKAQEHITPKPMITKGRLYTLDNE